MTTDTPVSQPPKVLFWFKIYLGLQCLLYLTFALFFLAEPAHTDMSKTAARVTSGLLGAIGFVLFGGCVEHLTRAPRPWLWTYDLVVICLGMASVCTLPASIALLIFWLKPEVKRYFGKTSA